MEKFEEFYEAQKGINDEIKKVLVNMKKDSSSRKTKKYLNERMDKVSALLDKAKKNHEIMESCGFKNHEYFTSKFIDQIESNTSAATDYILKCSEEVLNSQAPVISEDTDANQMRRVKELGFRIADVQEVLDTTWNSMSDMSAVQIECQLQEIRRQWDMVSNLHMEVRVNHADESMYPLHDQFQQLKTKYNQVLMAMVQRTTTNTNVTDSTTKSKIKLPTLQIPTFGGKYEEWGTFQDIFTKAIHENTTIPEVDKMHYLKTYTKGEASRLIQHFEITEANYKSAWETLQTRYHNQRLIVNTLINKILEIPVMHKESAKELKNLHDTTMECLQAINMLKVDTTCWGPLVLCILTKKIDAHTNELYEATFQNPLELQKLSDFLAFILRRFQSLEAQPKAKFMEKEHQSGKENFARYNSKPFCKFCSEEHYINYCPKFKALSTFNRRKQIKEKKLCFNCLNHDFNTKCNSTRTCMICKQNHHTLLHPEPLPDKRATKDGAAKSNSTTTAVANHIQEDNKTVLLATALIKVQANQHNYENLRALIDPGSQASFITEEACNLLGLPKQKITAKISGLGAETTECKYKITAACKPRTSNAYKFSTELLVIPKITNTTPSKEIKTNMNQWNNFHLADPTFYKPGPIDVLLGAQEYQDILLEGIRKTKNGLLGQNTELGWIIYGTSRSSNENVELLSMVSKTEENSQISKFWELEEITEQRQLTEDEKKCESIYDNSTTRDEDGKYTVRIPFATQPENVLGESRGRALARFFQLEKRLEKDNKLGNEYRKFMQEYIGLGHMEIVPIKENHQGRYYIPHQAVVKESSTTTKLRVVFDASCKTTNGMSLNDCMLTGPRLQQDLLDILLRWRCHKIAVSADIEKMYRQISIHPDDQEYHRILWRFSPQEPIREYRLTTITYGTASAPYLAVRTIQQLARDEKLKFPVASEVALKDFYVDDLLSGTDSEEDAIELQNQLIEMFKSGGLTLRKWSSNNFGILQHLPKELKDETALEIKMDDVKKSLGVSWAPHCDTISFNVDLPKKLPITKRSILSDTAKLFDPVGWLAPVIIQAKLLIQELWLQELSWDTPVPQSIQEKWTTFQKELPAVKDVSIPRWTHQKKGTKIELHGFCDASEKAYGAAVYLKTKKENGNEVVTLLTAKSKVAPARTKTTLPRLELCAAVLLAKLLKKVTTALQLQEVTIFSWTDSMIALAWINGHPSKWKTFVANRVSEIQSLLPISVWHHVRSEDNPADLVSRGLDPSKIARHTLWWNGPSWLTTGSYPATAQVIASTEIEAKQCISSLVATQQEEEICEKFSSLSRLLRTIAYCNRFVSASRRKPTTKGGLTVEEIQRSSQQLVKLEQQRWFAEEVKALTNKRQLDKQSKLKSLCPFLDKDGLVRVGGRLEHSLLSYNEKHPIIIPAKSNLGKLIIRDAHTKTLHGGPSQTLAFIRRRYWIVNAKKLVKSSISRCARCIRFRAQTSEQLMGQLPAPRVTPSQPFSHTGVDYAGPIKIRTTKGRGNKSYKGYIAIFVCLSTKAIHLEIVSDMTTEAFLAAFKRFTARRGTCQHMYSDNGTTFVGANKVLQNAITNLLKSNSDLQDQISTSGTQWHFIPPSAPHFGGLWEAGVKSTKHHLKRVIGESTLTYEELTTLTHQIEACLNSRPLCPQTEDINDYSILTPGHFLIGKELLSPIDVVSEDIDTEMIGRWKMIQKMKKDFWKSWCGEYLHQLQQRYKWNQKRDNMEIGNMVLVKEDCLSPSKWPLARVVDTHPDADGNIRVVTIIANNGKSMKRPIHKLVLLPTAAENGEGKLKPNPKRRSPGTLWKIAITTILFITSISSSTAELFNINYPEAGLYVEHISDAKVERGIFRIELKFPREKIQEDMKAITKVTKQLEDFCWKIQGLVEETECKTLIEHLKTEENQLKWIKMGLENAMTQKRSRRGLLGNLLTSVFGVNDEVYEDISTLDKNQKQLIHSSKQQTKFMLQALSKFNETEARINAKLNQFRSKLNQGIEAINSMNKWFNSIDENKLGIHLLSVYQVALNYLDEVLNHYRSLLHIHVNKGDFYEFISPAHIDAIILEATKKLPSNLEIISYPLMKTELEQRKNQTSLFGYFVMAEISNFTLLKCTPIPHRIENGFYWELDSTKNIMAIDYDTQRFFEVTDEELKMCMTINKQLYVCSPSFIRNIDNSPNCIIDELYRKSDKSTCPLSKTKINSSIWKQLYTPNSWLFISPTQFRVAFTCNGKRQDVFLNKTGIVTISPNCIISSKSTILTPRRSEGVSVIAGYTRPVDVNLTITRSNVKTIEIDDKIMKPSEEEINDLRSQQNDIQEAIEDFQWKKVVHHSMLISATTCVILVGSVLSTCWCIWRFRRHNKQKKVAQPMELTSTRPIQGAVSIDVLSPLKADD